VVVIGNAGGLEQDVADQAGLQVVIVRDSVLARGDRPQPGSGVMLSDE